MVIAGQSIGPWRERRVGDPVRGVSSEWVREGTAGAIRAVEASLLPGTDYEVDYTNPPMGTIIVRYAGYGTGSDSEILSSSFELQRNISSKSGYEHWKTLALPKSTINSIRRALKDNTTLSNLTGNANSFYNLMVNNVDSFIIANFVFRLTQTVKKNAVVDIAFENSMRIYTNAQLKAEVNAGPLYENAIDEAYNTVLNDYYQGSIPSGRTLGWLKIPPTISTISGDRSAISVEYWLEATSTYYY